MASDINSRGRKGALSSAALRAHLVRATAQNPVPLLVLRLPDFERTAWRSGKTAARRLERKTTAAFLRAAARALRAGDLAAHDPGSDVFSIAMAAPARAFGRISPVDCRSVLERVAAALHAVTGLRIETGWMVLQRFDPQASLEPEIERALERGARERERYEFFSTVGHELRTPLASIRGYLETLLEGEVDRDTAARFLRTARREALRMGRLVDGMFEFSLLDLSAGALLGRHCRLGEQIDAAFEVTGPGAAARSIAVERANRDDAIVALDPDACLQILVNLIDNAAKYGREGGTVAVSVEVRGEDAAIVVDDDGPGIAACNRDSIFGLRVRGPQSGSRPGTGIGLAIVKMIVERSGGQIRVLDSPLGGARFEALLPRADSQAQAS